MCNLYSITRSQEAMRTLFALDEDLVGNLPSMPAVFPDMMAPIVRRDPRGARRLEMMRWGLPGAPRHGGAPVTNIRNPGSAHWRAWLGPDHRCLVPANSFCEWADGRPKVPTWFALDPSRPLFAFAGIWTAWTGVRGPKSAPTKGDHRLFGFLTTRANGVVAPVHPKAMPVLLTDPREWDVWLRAPWSEAASLQRPLADNALRIAATGETQDSHADLREAEAQEAKPPDRMASSQLALF